MMGKSLDSHGQEGACTGTQILTKKQVKKQRFDSKVQIPLLASGLPKLYALSAPSLSPTSALLCGDDFGEIRD